jgi:hypothetical protein
VSGDDFFDDSVSQRVDLAVVRDHARAQEICAALQRAGLDDVKCWPEDAMTDQAGPAGRGFWEELSGSGASEWFGPFHIRVWEEDLAKAQVVLADSGLQES